MKEQGPPSWRKVRGHSPMEKDPGPLPHGGNGPVNCVKWLRVTPREQPRASR